MRCILEIPLFSNRMIYVSHFCASQRQYILYFSYWDLSIDQSVMRDRVGLNLLYAQTVHDVERGWILTNHEIQRQLAALQAKGAKREVNL